MCYIFNCFGWALDFLQRAITFVLTCILCCVISVGIVVAIAAGVAYGYNYSMAEFLTFSRQDVTVYMRRGQFYDRPDFAVNSDVLHNRRSGGQDAFAINKSLDYQDSNSAVNAKPLSDTWSEVHDTRKYAEVLTKYSKKPDHEVDQINNPLEEPSTDRFQPGIMTGAILITHPPLPTLPSSVQPMMRPVIPVRKVSISPNPRLIETTVMQSGTSQIIMRNFQPLQEATNTDRVEYRLDELDAKPYYPDDDDIYTKRQTKFFSLQASRPTKGPDVLKSVETLHEKPVERARNRYVPKSNLNIKKSVDLAEDSMDYIDEENIVYKPV